MLHITIGGGELFNEVTNEFIEIKPQKIALEHSLVSISKWESKWHKPFLATSEKTPEEIIDYIKLMTITQNVSDETYLLLTQENIDQIKAYIDDPMTATWFSENKAEKKKGPSEIVTAELIYYWMIALNIPFECQKWHINKLMTLIQVCNVKNAPPKKMSKRELMSRNKALNEARKAKLGTKG